jgi:nicotinate-nucleotide adenylyltransferase
VRLGVLGGSFDPPHVGHLLAASDAFEALALDRLLFVPAATSPFKQGVTATPPADRLAMVRLLVRGDPRFAVDPMEIEREGLSYTVDTLAALAVRYPDAERFLLVGEDVVESFAGWREPDRIVQLARLVVLRRARGPEGSPAAVMPGAVQLETRRVDVSSTEIRARVRAGRSLRGFVPDEIAGYIEEARLYRQRNT